MSATPETIPDQGSFMECYRGRQSALHHAAYMRMAKVLLALELSSRAGITLEGKDILDYGFGAGTFYRYCPRDSRLFGVEMDEENIAAVRDMLEERGFPSVDLQKIEIERWAEHPLLARKYDVILCSHVLEHLPDPAMFLKRIGECLNPAGLFIGLVPLNERIMDPHHVQRLNEAKIRALAETAGLRVTHYLEADPWLYWFQPLFTRDRGWVHLAAQTVSIGLGVPATLLGHRLWFALGRVFGALTLSKPAQAAFVLAKGTAS
jgi:SAM-dependent methyltransferase